MIPRRVDLISWLKEFIDDIRKQEIAVNSAKITAAAVGAVSFIGLFTPLAPLAIAGMVGAGAAGVATTIGDVISNKIKGDNLKDKVEEMKQNDSKLSELMKKVEEGSSQLQKELKISKEDAFLFLLVGVPKTAAQAGVQFINGNVEIARVLPHLKAARDAMVLGTSFTQAFRLSGTVSQGAGRASVLGEGQAAKLGGPLFLTTTAKALGDIDAMIIIADVIFNWLIKTPNRASAEELLPKVEKNLETLEQMKKELSQLKNN